MPINRPNISVLLSVYNGDNFLETAIKSILNQTFSDFEFIIINDGSTDRSEEIITRYNHPQIRLIRNQSNIGLTKSLNKGIALADGKYIARMDADDISLPHRLEKQFEFMEKNPHIALVGSWFDEIDTQNRRIGINRMHVESLFIRWRLLFRNAFGHSAVMLRKQALKDKHYDESIRYGQDYDLWSRLSQVYETANIAEVLVQWRVNTNNISSMNKKEQRQIGENISRRNIEFIWGGPIPDEDFYLFRALCGLTTVDINHITLKNAIQNINKLKLNFLKKFGYFENKDLHALKTEVAIQILFLINNNVSDLNQRIILYRLWHQLLKPNCYRIASSFFMKKNTNRCN